MSLHKTIDGVRSGPLAEFISLARIAYEAREGVAAQLAQCRLEPIRMASALASATARPAEDVIVTGHLEQRVLLLRASGEKWGVLSLSGTPLQDIPWPGSIKEGCRFEHPELDVSAARLTKAAEYRLTRPVVQLIALYHEENFPLPRFALGISDVARAIRAAMTGQVRLSDMQLEAHLDEIVAEVENDEPDILGVSATFGQHDLLTELLNRLDGRLRENRLLLVLGGSLSALNAELLLKRYPNAIVARGAGEPTMIDVVEYWHGDRDVAQIRNIRYSGSEIIYLTKRISNREYNEIGPELDLLDPTLARHGVMQLESSRGCTHACSFCPREHKGLWAGYDAVSLGTLLQDISPVYARHPEIAKKIFLVDEEFIGRDRTGEALQRAVDVSRTLRQAGFRWETSSRVDQVHRPTEDAAWHHRRIAVWRELRRNGLDRCLFGVESGVDSILKRFNKHSTADQNVKAVRILTALGLPIRCTYITFDQLMSMDELVASYRFQGRRDMTLRPVPDIGEEELFDLVLDEERLAPYLAGSPFYEQISYMLVSMECLLGSPYLRQVEKAGLAGEILPSMGRRNAVFQDRRIGAMSEWSQRWVDHNFSLDYTLKSFEKVTVGAEYEAVREMRRVLKASAYTLLGRMLWLCLGDESLFTPADRSRAGFTARFLAGSLAGTDAQADHELLAQLADSHISELREEFSAQIGKLYGTLTGTRVKLLARTWEQWQRRSDWSLINPPEMCIAE
jgi:hypothetical protein